MEARHADATGSESVERRSTDLAPVGTEIRVSEIVGQYQGDVGSFHVVAMIGVGHLSLHSLKRIQWAVSRAWTC